MAKFSICLEPVLNEIDLCERIKVVSECGFDGFEFWEPTDKEIKKVAKYSAQYDIPLVGCTLLNQWEIRANDSIDLVRCNLIKTIEYTADAGCKTFIFLTGENYARVDTQKNILIENMKRLADVAEKMDVTLAIEPLNTYVDHKGYYLDSAYLGYEIVRCVGSNKVKLLFDCYHMQIMEGNLIDNITKNIQYTGHIHIAGVPGRHEPFIGEVNYPNIVKGVEKAGYKGYFGLEYWPTYDSVKSLQDSLAYLKS